jgi:hypothetical protein
MIAGIGVGIKIKRKLEKAEARSERRFCLS